MCYCHIAAESEEFALQMEFGLDLPEGAAGLLGFDEDDDEDEDELFNDDDSRAEIDDHEDDSPDDDHDDDSQNDEILAGGEDQSIEIEAAEPAAEPAAEDAAEPAAAPAAAPAADARMPELKEFLTAMGMGRSDMVNASCRALYACCAPR